jgi:hypothetical protein
MDFAAFVFMSSSLKFKRLVHSQREEEVKKALL